MTEHYLLDLIKKIQAENGRYLIPKRSLFRNVVKDHSSCILRALNCSRVLHIYLGV